MKKILLGLTLSLLASTSALAGFQSKQDAALGNWNRITIYNHTNQHIAYVMSGMYGGATYYISPQGADTYHSGYGDEYAEVKVGLCNQSQGDSCTAPVNLNICSGSGHYNADHIKEVHINSLSSCSIICLDGSATSCRQGG